MTAPTEDQRLEQLVQAMAPHSRLLGVWRLSGGISAEMTALEIERPDGLTSKMIVRRPSAKTLERNPHAAQDEFKLLQLTQSVGLATPTPYYLDQSGTIFSTPCIVVEYIEGNPEFAPANVADYILQLATQLARIHRVDGSSPGVSFLPEHTLGCAETIGPRPAAIDTALDQEHARDALGSRWPAPQRNAPALLHGDYWPGNVLWRDEKLVAVIDWEDATRGDPLIDVAISRLDVLCIFGIDAMHAFTQQYQSLMAIDYSNLPYWDLCAALRLARLAGAALAEWAAFFRPFGRYDITEYTIREHYRHFTMQALKNLTVR